MTRRILRPVAVALIVALAGGACTGTERSSESYCNRLGEVTGPGGAEVAFSPSDPASLDAIVEELRDLVDRAPGEIRGPTTVTLEFFEAWQRAPRNDRRALLTEREADLIEASRALDDYALTTCGLFLQRAVPTPLPTPDPGVEIAPE